MQWRIQDFPDGGTPTPKRGANLLFGQIFTKTLYGNEINWTERGRAFLAPPPRIRQCEAILPMVYVAQLWTQRVLQPRFFHNYMTLADMTSKWLLFSYQIWVPVKLFMGGGIAGRYQLLSQGCRIRHWTRPTCTLACPLIGSPLSCSVNAMDL